MIHPETAARLDRWYAHVESVFLSRLSAGAGLLPASTATTVHGDYRHAWVRDNVYSILGAWALGKACRRYDTGEARAERLETAVRGVMRGLLRAMMAQSQKVERFKHTQNPLDALHAKYDAETGAVVVEDDRWGHLQIDATSLFLLVLAQMTVGGLAIVENADEAAFIQNLVHYLGPAYRIADYGIWERGRKTNDGSVEINASSVGMAKAALEAVRGLELLGDDPRGRIFVPPDDIARARESLQALLPQESVSKETDGALLSVLFWPGYAMADANLLAISRERILKRLEGRYGLKRFLRDGHQTAVEDHGRLHYETGELANFDRIESEWPLFFTYLLVDARLRGDRVMGAHWQMKLDPLFVLDDGMQMLPELYTVPADRVQAEFRVPGSQLRTPGENVPLLWAQSNWIIGELLGEGLIEPDDIDPLRRRLVPGDAERGLKAPIRISVLAETERAQDMLAKLGFRVQTLAEVADIADVRHAGHLRDWLARVGANQALGLTGRPHSRRLGSMSMARIYEAGPRRFVFSPMLPEDHDSHLRFDAATRARSLLGDLRYLARHARGADPVLLVAALDEETLGGPGAEQMVALLERLRDGSLEDIRVEWLGFRSALHDLPRVNLGAVPPDALLAPEPVRPAVEAADASVCWQRLHEARVRGDRDAMEDVQRTAARSGHWQISREAAASLGFVDQRLPDSVKDLVVRLRRLDLSPLHQTEQAVLSRPVALHTVTERLAYMFPTGGSAIGVVAQEVLIALGLLVKSPGDLLKGTRTIRLAELVELLAQGEADGLSGGIERLCHLSPSDLMTRLEALLRATPTVRMVVGPDPQFALLPGVNPEQDWHGWRRRIGVLIKVRTDFYARVWSLLHAVDGVRFGSGDDPAGRLDARAARGDFTSHERDFAHVLESRIVRIRDPRYRALCLETLNVLAAHHERHPDLPLAPGCDVALDPLIHEAADLLAGRQGGRDWGVVLNAAPDVVARALHAVVLNRFPPESAAKAA
jgi:phosphorylase kinase alpha/beta subunit